MPQPIRPSAVERFLLDRLKEADTQYDWACQDAEDRSRTDPWPPGYQPIALEDATAYLAALEALVREHVRAPLQPPDLA